MGNEARLIFELLTRGCEGRFLHLLLAAVNAWHPCVADDPASATLSRNLNLRPQCETAHMERVLIAIQSID